MVHVSLVGLVVIFMVVLLQGSYICGPCIPGWVGSNLYGCRPGNFCMSGENNCDEHASCIYLGPAQFKCVCNNGWAGDGVLCGEDPDQDGIVTVAISCTEPGCRRVSASSSEL